MICTLLLTAALAQDAGLNVPNTETVATAPVTKEWVAKSFASPDVGVAGVVQDLNEPFFLAFGGSAGVQSTQQGGWFFGAFRVHADWIIGTDKRGHQIRAGVFGGLHHEWWGVELGLDGWRNRYELEDFSLPATFGLDVPLQVAGGPRQLHGVAGIAVAAVVNPDRRVDWDTAEIWGFGHEFKRWIGVQTRLKQVVLGLVYYQRQMAGELVQGFTISATQ
jgi:hypothetical protein